VAASFWPLCRKSERITSNTITTGVSTKKLVKRTSAQRNEMKNGPQKLHGQAETIAERCQKRSAPKRNRKSQQFAIFRRKYVSGGEKEKVAPTPAGSFISRLKPLSLTFALAHTKRARERTVKSTHAVVCGTSSREETAN
jgi:hypothetical protein